MNQLVWSDAKNRLNITKHGVNFEEAGTIFDDPLQVTINDPDHSSDEQRFLTFGVSFKNRLLIVAHVFRDDKSVLYRRENRPVGNAAIMKKESLMRKEYDFSRGERGKFFGKVDTANPIIETEDEPLIEVFADELDFLESNLARIKRLKSRLTELDEPARKEVSARISNASQTLDKIAVSK